MDIHDATLVVYIMKNRLSIKFGGQSGQGINTLGELLAKCIKNSGYHLFASREYPSLIKGGVASYQLDFSDYEIYSSSRYTNILACLAPQSIHEYIYSIDRKGILVHSINDLVLTKEEEEYIHRMNIEVIHIDTEKISHDIEAPIIMANMILLGYISSIVGIDEKELEKVVKKYFKGKNIDILTEIKCITKGYELDRPSKFQFNNNFKKHKGWNKSKVVTGNLAIALGAISAGCRAYYAYPMTPSTPILEMLGATYKQTGILVKQAESEITAVQMAMGSMYMGTRAFTATSGGGFDLMTETLSSAGMTETPLVIVLGQRQGPSTGGPTWTATQDLDAALDAGHGEFPRCILSTSDALDSYELIQKAFNIAEQYQIPVILLTEKQNAEALFNIYNLPKALKIQRGIRNGRYRYEITENGISPRWIPMKGRKTYLANSDEHTQDGFSTENSLDVSTMYEKRMNKLQTLQSKIPDPKYFGSTKSNTIFVTFGTPKNAVLDAMKETREDIGLLLYQYIFPLKYEKIFELEKEGKRLILLENNHTGQFGKLVKRECGYEFKEKLLKYDSRPFFMEDILDFLKKQ